MKTIHYHEHGGLDQLQYGDIAAGEPVADQVRVRLQAAALNRSDLFTLEGWPGLSLEMPHIPGADGAGVVEKVGNGVERLTPGDRVVINPNLSDGTCDRCLAGMDNQCRDWHLLGETRRGTFAEYVVVPERNLLPMPKGFDPGVAAAGALVFLTAWHSLITRGDLQMGEKVLIIGASGGVNTASIQIAKLSGAHVTVIGSSAPKLELAESCGADMLIDRSAEEDWSKAAYRASGKQGYDVVVDNVGAPTMPHSLRAARKGGRVLTVGNTAGPKFEIDNRFVFYKHLSILGSTMGTHEDFAKVMGLVFAGKLKPVIDRTYPLEEARLAFERMQRGEQMGKLVLAIA